LISDRKLMHLEICRDREVGARRKTTHLSDVELVHMAMPELDLGDVSTATRLFGKQLSAPLMISAMTGGHPSAKKVNESLGMAAAELAVAISVGSQRAAVEDARLEDSFRVVREVSDKILVVANMGAAQLLSRGASEFAQKAVKMVSADALAIHLNPLQELVQPRGDSKYKGVLKGISSVVRSIGVPVIVKETGCGISKEVAAQLSDAGVAAIEVAGAGGTSWAAVEHYNALMNGDKAKAEIAETFWDWGIPTAMSICEAVSARRSLKGKFKVIASGGIKDGIDVAKSLVLGADLAGVARPLLIPAFHGHKEVAEKLMRIVHELKITCLLCGCRSVGDLGKAKAVISGGLRDWIEQRGLEIGRVEEVNLR